MNIEFIGKFYDNHSLSIINRNILLELSKLGLNIKILPLDTYDPEYQLDKNIVKSLKAFENTAIDKVDIQLRHSYPPIWSWPEDSNTRVVFIQPWEFSKAPFEWQYKFETFADALVVPSNYCKNVFKAGGMKPSRIFVVPNGYSSELFNIGAPESVEHLGVSDKTFNFMYVGNSQWRKGLDILLNSWSKAFKKYDNAKLIIKDNPRVYGHSNILSEIIKLQYKTNCADIIYIDDNLSEKDMANLYKVSKVIVHPYRAEGFGMHVQEAVACGCVPIVSSNGPTDDFIPDSIGIKLPVNRKPINIEDPNIFALKPGDAATMMSTHTFINEPSPQHLEKAMQYVYNNYDTVEAYKESKNTLVSNLTDWNDVSKLYVAAFKEIMTYEIVRKA